MIGRVIIIIIVIIISGCCRCYCIWVLVFFFIALCLSCPSRRSLPFVLPPGPGGTVMDALNPARGFSIAVAITLAAFVVVVSSVVVAVHNQRGVNKHQIDPVVPIELLTEGIQRCAQFQGIRSSIVETQDPQEGPRGRL